MFRNFFGGLCLFLCFLLATTSLVSNENQVAKPQPILGKYKKEMLNLLEEFNDPPNKEKPSLTIQTRTYSVEEYGLLAAPLNKFRQTLEIHRQEKMIITQALNEVDVNRMLRIDTFFDFLKIIDEKKKLERLLICFDQSEKRIEKACSEYQTWLISSPDLDEFLRNFILEDDYQQNEKVPPFIKKYYTIKKNIIRELIKFFDFMSKIYGTYEKGEDSAIICSNNRDALTLDSYLETLANLFKEDENLVLQWQKYTKKEWIEFTKMDPISDSTLKEYLEKHSLSKCLNEFVKLCKEMGIVIDQAHNEVIVSDICSESVIFDLIKLKEQKKKLERMSVVLDESEKKYVKVTSDLIGQTKRSSISKNQISGEPFELFEKIIIPTMKQSIVLTQNYVFELKNLIDFLLIRYGNYTNNTTENRNFNICFEFEIDYKIYEYYTRKIENLFKENQKLNSYVDQIIKEFTLR